MKPSIFRAPTLFFCISLLVFLVDGKDISYDWTVSLSQRSPLGANKEVIVINDQFPGPLLNATTNDILNINIHNNLTEPFLMTWNGLQMRKNSWQDGMQETNCPILPGKNWTYSFQVKDQIGSFFYFPSILFQKAAGGFGPIRVNNRLVIPIPFPEPDGDIDVLIGDWYNADHREMRKTLDSGMKLPQPDGVLINGFGPNQAIFDFVPGATYRLRISNVGLKTTLNFRIQDHSMLLVETEGSYTLQQPHDNLDIHVGQSYSVLVTAKNQTHGESYYMVASSRLTDAELSGVGIIRYPNSVGFLSGPLPSGPHIHDYFFSLEQARSIRWNLTAGAARPNPQGSYHYGSINVSRTIILRNDESTESRQRYTVNGVSFVHPETPLKMADYFQLGVCKTGIIPDRPIEQSDGLTLNTSVIDANYRQFYHLVFENPTPSLQTWHLDGYNFFVVGMDFGTPTWDENLTGTYNLYDAVSRSTVQVYPFGWTAIMVMLDNQGMWNLRSQDLEKWYQGQELYLRVRAVGEENPATIPVRDEFPIPENAIFCGKATQYQ